MTNKTKNNNKIRKLLNIYKKKLRAKSFLS